MFWPRVLQLLLLTLLSLALMSSLAMATPLVSAMQPNTSRDASQSDGTPAASAPTVSRARFPILFIANQGQWAPDILFEAQAGAVRLLFMAHEVRIQVPGAQDTLVVARLHLSPTDAAPLTLIPGERASTRVSYFRGSDVSDRQTNVPAYHSLRYQGVTPGVDLVFRDADGAVAYDLIVAPGADPSQVKLAFTGVETLTLDDGGAMSLVLPSGVRLRQQAPFIYQERAGERVAVNGGFVIHDADAQSGQQRFGFQVAAHDPELPLIIDPTLTYSSFVGSSLTDEARALIVTSTGDVIVVGSTLSTSFSASPLPTVIGTKQSKKDALIYKIANDGGSLDYVTILAGLGDEQINAVIEATDGSLYLTGQTTSADFPTVDPLFPLLSGSQDAFIAQLNATGDNLLFSTYFGGSKTDLGRALGLDSDGRLYVAGNTDSTDLFTQHALYPSARGGNDGFVVKLTITGGVAMLNTSTYFGGTGSDSIEGLLVTAEGDLYLGGTTASKDLPVTSPLQPALAGGTDVWIARIATEGPELAFCTYLGGTKNDALSALLFASDGNLMLAGSTDSPDFPVTNTLYSSLSGKNDAFIAKLSASGRFLHFATYFGGADDDRALAMALDQIPDTDGQRHLYVAGSTLSTLLPTVNPDQRWYAGAQDGWLAKLDPRGLNLGYASYFGGTASDSIVALGTRPATGSGEIFLAGNTLSKAAGYFPEGINIPYQADNKGGIDTFVAHVEDMDSSDLIDVDPTLRLDFKTMVPERDGAAVALNLALNDQASVGISAFTTEVHYDINTLEFEDLVWASPLNAPPYVTDLDHATPGVLRLSLYQDGTPVALPKGTLVTLNFEVRDVGTLTTPPKPSKLSSLTLHKSEAADLGGRKAFIDDSMGTGGVLLERRCNNLIGDCDCSGRVRIWEVQSGVIYNLESPSDQPICVKRDYTAMSATDLTEIVNNYLDQVIETTAITSSLMTLEDEVQAKSLASVATAANLKLTKLPEQNGEVGAGLVLRTGGNAISVLRTDIVYNPKLFSSVKPIIGPAAKKASKRMAFRVIKPGLLRVLIYGINKTSLPNGTIATLRLVPKVDLTGRQFRLTHSPQASSPDARAIKVTATNLELP